MAISHLLEALTDDLDTTVSALDLPEGTNYSTIARMARNGEITTGGGATDIYKVASIAERDALTGVHEGDMCVVTSSSIGNWEETTNNSSITFPATVVLSNAFSDWFRGNLRADQSSGENFDGMIELSEQDFRLDGWGDNIQVRVQYNSNDGITYTRQRIEAEDMSTGDSLVDGDTINLPFNVYIDGNWTDEIGYFMQVGVKTFDGLFTYDGSDWNYSYVGVNLNANDLLNSKKAYTNNGYISGTLGVNPSMSFNDNNILIYNAYNLMTPRVLTDNDKTINSDIIAIPIKTNGIPLLDTSRVTNMMSMFQNCTKLTSIPLLDTSNVTTMENMFYGCSNITSIPLLDTSNVTSMVYMFHNCSNITSIPLLDTSNVTSMTGIFDYCSSITSIPLLDTSNVTSMVNMFRNCGSLTSIPLLNTSKVTDMSCMFMGCWRLPSIPLLDTSHVTKMEKMFYGCSGLTSIPLLNTSNLTNKYAFSDVFKSCNNLDNNSLNNILQMCINAVSYPGTKTLKTLGILDTTYYPASRIEALSNYQDFINAGWTIGY